MSGSAELVERAVVDLAPEVDRAPVTSVAPSRRGLAGVVVRKFARRLLLAACTVWIVATACFIGVHAMPGEVVDVLLGDEPSSPEMRAQVASQWGLDRSVPVQYLDYLGRLVTGNLGESYQLREPVTSVLGGYAAPTLELAVTSSALGITLALLLAVTTVGRRRLGRISRAVELVLASLPHLWVGMLLLLAFSFTLGWFPATGANSAAALALPTVALAIGVTGVLASVARDEIERALDQPFARTARARGAGRARVILAHGVPHALLPLVPLAGWTFANVCGGALIVEQVFSRPGFGQLAVSAVRTGDVPVVTGIAIVGVVVFVGVSLGCDLIVAMIDPRRAR